MADKQGYGYAKRILLFLLLCAYFAVAYPLMNYYNVSCVFLDFLGIPCPGCGMTRALFSVLRADFYGAVKYNIVIFFMPYVFVYMLFDLRHRVHKFLLLGIAGIAVINWIVKIIIFFYGG